MEYTAEQLGQLNKTLQELADEKYRTFHSRLIPNVDTVFYGVRVPELRKLAKQIIKGYELAEHTIEMLSLNAIKSNIHPCPPRR